MVSRTRRSRSKKLTTCGRSSRRNRLLTRCRFIPTWATVSAARFGAMPVCGRSLFSRGIWLRLRLEPEYLVTRWVNWLPDSHSRIATGTMRFVARMQVHGSHHAQHVKQCGVRRNLQVEIHQTVYQYPGYA